VSEWHKRFTERLRKQKSWMKIMLAASLIQKVSFITNSTDKETVNGKFDKKAIKRFIAEVHGVRQLRRKSSGRSDPLC
jgi:hypothetical protein